MVQLILIFIFLIVAVLLAVSFYFTVQAIQPNCMSVEKQIQRCLIDNGLDPALAELPCETWRLSSRRGSALLAHFYPCGDNEKIVLLNHGYNSPWISMLKYYELLHDMGYALLLPDHQAEGESEGKWITYGILESEDGLLWLDELKARYPSAELAVAGESMGAATALLIAEQHSGLRFCLADCPYSDMTEELNYMGRKRYHLPMDLVMPLVKVWFRLLTGCSMSEASPKNNIQHLQVPTLLVHGTADPTCPVTMSRELSAVNEHITYWEAPDCRHAEVVCRRPEEYRRQMESFLSELEEVSL